MKKTLNRSKRQRSPEKSSPSPKLKSKSSRELNNIQSPNKKFKMNQTAELGSKNNGIIAPSKVQTGPRKITIKKLRCTFVLLL